ncbi:hypothetical protein AW729_05580 [Methanosphaera sp. BMS]|nr:hypothetical protein AW729_05580 [Methanosphaera sp. BMS]
MDCSGGYRKVYINFVTIIIGDEKNKKIEKNIQIKIKRCIIMGLADIIFAKKDSKDDLLKYLRKHDLYPQLTPDGVKKMEKNINYGDLRNKQQIDKSIELLVKTNKYTKDKYGKTYF